ncbi:MAG: hypothetical protein FWD77_04410 [Betaproteobacteria bacterium]|nr:hypothetical protein [Betaproteobacteria bacterium]
MKRFVWMAFMSFALAGFLIAPQVSLVFAQEEAKESPAQRILRVSKEGATDAARVKTIDAWLAKVSQNTGETPDAIVHACMRNARYLFDAGKVRAAPVELLEALNTHSSATEPLNDTLHRYDAARLAAPKSSHADAMRAMGAGGAERR